MTETHLRKTNPPSGKTDLGLSLEMNWFRQAASHFFPDKTPVNLLNNSKMTKNQEKIHFLQTDF